MDEGTLRRLLTAVNDGSVTPDDAVATLRSLPYADLGYARIDHHRELRQGFPEAIYGPGKTPEQCVGAVGELLERGTGPVILTRSSADQLQATTTAHPGARVIDNTAVWRPTQERSESVLLLTAGTADIPVARESESTLTAMGFVPQPIYDVGVAGVHRLLAVAGELQTADAIIVFAGMEGALASVVGGITGAPVVAVPTSTGYGSSLEGVTALLSMHASCAAGITVVGIDNGFGAACAIARMFNTAKR